MTHKINVPVLMYHGIEDESQSAGYDDAGALLYVLNKQQFVEQMQYLKDHGYQVVSLLALADGEHLPEKAVVITFDDGHCSDYSIALPVLKSFAYTACFYITTKWLGSENYLSPEQVMALDREAMLIGSHGVTHRFFNDMSADRARHELKESKKVLDQLVTAPVISFSAPGGRLADDTVSQARSLGYESVATSVVRPFGESDNLLSVPRVAIKSTTTIEEFSKIVSCDSSYYFNLSIKHRALVWAKKLLGNGLYEQLRAVAIRK